MTAQILSSELANILYESKKKQTDLRGAVDRSTQELKALPQTSEAQISADLRRRVNFASPFLLACSTNNPKLALPAVTALQRLIVSKGLAPERLQETLNAFQECSKINLDIQLKILQSLPSLLQNYASHLEGELQANTIELCTNLQQVKSAPVSSTASATLQQIVSSVFDKVEHEDSRSSEIPTTIALDLDGETFRVRSAAHDAFRVLQDICLMLEGQRPTFAQAATLQQPFGLELIEAILTNNGELFDSHNELGHVLRARVMPIVTRLLSERLGFGVTVRVTRIFCIILREHLELVRNECEIPLTLLNHLLESDSATPWRRALCMEIFRIIYSVPNLAMEIYALFDQQESKRNLIQENLANFVRLASEKPALIGVGSQSSYPAGQQSKAASQEQAVLEANSVAGIISGESGVTEVAAPGISVKWSSMKTPCLEQLDKAEATSVPDTYVYSLALTCLNNLSDGAAKVILPMTIPHHSKSPSKVKDGPIEDESGHPQNEAAHGDKRRVVNPLDQKDHPSHGLVVTIAHMIDSCWPAILATSSTFLNAALDADYYRGLIRSVQRFTQIAGLLRLSTPRDAFLTTLTKSAVPAHLVKTDLQVPQTPSIASPRTPSASGSDSFFNLAGIDSPALRSGRPDPFDGPYQVMSQRNLMCLRALINLAIALGSILGESWKIIIESLQKADNVLAQSGNALAREYRSATHGGDRASSDPNSDQSSLTSEIAAVEAAVTRLFQSTSEYPNEAFVFILEALFEVVGDAQPINQSRTLHFALAKIGEISRINIRRLALEGQEWGWDHLTQRARSVATALSCDSTARLMAADITSSLALGVSLATVNEDAEVRGQVQARAIECLETEVATLYETLNVSGLSPSGVDMDVHRSAVEAVRSILENCGDSMISGWRSTFSIVQSAFAQVGITASGLEVASSVHTTSGTAQSASDMTLPRRKGDLPKPISARILKSAFACVQLICSDFLASLKHTRIVFLIDIFSLFCSQTPDMNTSLTTLTLFWNLSDFLQSLMVQHSSGEERKPRIIVGQDVRTIAEQGSLPAIWMSLLEQLASMTEDDRGDVRNGAVQTVFRILDNSAENFEPDMWAFALKEIVLRMALVDIRAYTSHFSDSHKTREPRPLHATTDTLLKSLASSLVSQSKAIINLPNFEELWAMLLKSLGAYLDFEDDVLYKLVFEFTTQTLSCLENPGLLGEKSLDAVLVMWRRNGPERRKPIESATRDEQALISYIEALRQFYPAIKGQVQLEEMKNIADNIMACATAAQAPQYTSDVDSMTALQSKVLECLVMLWSDLPGFQSYLIDQMSSFIELPYRSLHMPGSRGSLSYVAFAKGGTNTLTKLINSMPDSSESLSAGAITNTLKSLVIAVSQRYLHLTQGKEPALWRGAATASITILSKVLPELRRLHLKQSIVDGVLFENIRLAKFIREADLDLLPSSNDILVQDESFDLEALAQWRHCNGIQIESNGAEVVTVHRAELNQPSLSENIRLQYVESLFTASLFHETRYQFSTLLLKDLNKVRPGRVNEPSFNPRIRICYASLDELFAIAGHGLHTGAASSPLAITALPYLILRCALPLQRYIADQPLRGKMPTPTSQRMELLYILRRMTHLRKELHQLVPLISKASTCARSDGEVANAMQTVLEATFIDGQS